MSVLLRMLLSRLVAALAVTGISVGAVYATGAKLDDLSVVLIIPGTVLLIMAACTFFSCTGEGCLIDFFEHQRAQQQQKYLKFVGIIRNRKRVGALTLILGLVLVAFGMLIRG